ncbi:MAG: hypothetical protein QXE18_06185 [Thermoplasmata archaeon]
MPESEDRGVREKELDAVIIVLIVAISVILYFFLPYILYLDRHEFIAEGTFYINDSGESHGGFEYAGTFYANLTWTDSTWALLLSLKTGLGDPLPFHAIKIYSNYYSDGNMILNTEKGRIVLEYMAEDPIWGNMINGTFTAVYSPSGPASENIGSISAEIFGLPAHYYVQLSLVPSPLGV